MFFEIYSYYYFVFIIVFVLFYQVKDIFPIYDFYKKSVLFEDILNKKISKPESSDKNDLKSDNSSDSSVSSASKKDLTNSNIENNDDSSVLKKVFNVVAPVVCIAIIIFGCYCIYKNIPSDFFDPKRYSSPSLDHLSSIPPLQPFPSLEVSSLGLSMEQQDYLLYILDQIKSLSFEEKAKIFSVANEKPHRYAEFLRYFEKKYYNQ